MTQERLAEVQERCKRATEGPWDANGRNVYAESYASAHNINGCVACCAPSEDEEPLLAEANADFIAHARQDIPELLAHIEATDKAVKSLVEAAGEYVRASDATSEQGAFVGKQQGVHKHECSAWRSGNGYGPCSCGAEALDEAIKAANTALRESLRPFGGGA